MKIGKNERGRREDRKVVLRVCAMKTPITGKREVGRRTCITVSKVNDPRSQNETYTEPHYTGK